MVRSFDKYQSKEVTYHSKVAKYQSKVGQCQNKVDIYIYIYIYIYQKLVTKYQGKLAGLLEAKDSKRESRVSAEAQRCYQGKTG